MFTGKSDFETRVGRDLEEREVPFIYEAQSFEYRNKPYNAMCASCGSEDVWETRSYTPDFFLLNSGIIVEAKGHWTPAGRRMVLAVMENNDVEIRMVFMRDNWLTKKRKTRYSEWCDQHGIKWAISRVPEDWL